MNSPYRNLYPDWRRTDKMNDVQKAHVGTGDAIKSAAALLGRKGGTANTDKQNASRALNGKKGAAKQSETKKGKRNAVR